MSAVFVVQDANGVSLIQSVVQGGFARAVIEAPDQAGDVVLSARVSGAESAATTLRFAPALNTFGARLEATSAGANVIVGPVITNRGGYVPDGTEVTIRDRDSNNVVGRAALKGGFAEVPVEQANIALEAVVLSVAVAVEGS